VQSYRHPPTVDAFTAEVIRNAVVAITREMKTNLMHTAHSSIIYEAEDFTVGLSDADGHTISIGTTPTSLPVAPMAISTQRPVAYWRERMAVPDSLAAAGKRSSAKTA
jgi:N-methylhydantoinase B/oxoprolinase/acetone carboxylase alpha subunit